MSTDATLIAQYKADATTDLATLNTLKTAEASPFAALIAAINTAVASLVDPARQTALAQIATEIQQAENDFLTLMSETVNAQTATPNI